MNGVLYSDIFLFHHPKIGMDKNELFILKTLGDTKIAKLRPHKWHDENPREHPPPHPHPRVWMTEHLYNNTFASRCGAYLGFGTYSSLFTLELSYNTTAPYFFFLLFFPFILFFYRGQGTFIRFNFIALDNAMESAAWSIIGNWLSTSYLRNAERLFPWRGIINKVLCRKAPPLSSYPFTYHFWQKRYPWRIFYWNGIYFRCFTYCAYLRTRRQFVKLINDITKLDIEHHRCRRYLYWKCFTGRWFYWKCFTGKWFYWKCFTGRWSCWKCFN